MSPTNAVAAKLAVIAAEAGAIVMRHYRAGAEARLKDDRSPVTDADEEAETFILAALARAFPDMPVAAEEAARGRPASSLNRRRHCMSRK
ncbi:MAG: inositol monophosphatase family protein [Rhizomicrobium sp.]